MALRPARIQVTNETGTALEDVDVYTDAAAVAVESEIVPQTNVKAALEALAPLLKTANSAAAVTAVAELTHTKGEEVNALTGLGTQTGLVACQFETTAPINEGEAVTVDGETYALKLLSGKCVSGTAAVTPEKPVIASGVAVVAVADTSKKVLTVQNDIPDEMYLTFPASGWAGAAAPYTQTITATGILASDVPIIGANITATDAASALALKEAFAMIGRVETGAGTLTAYCYEEKPGIDVPVIVKMGR